MRREYIVALLAMVPAALLAQTQGTLLTLHVNSVGNDRLSGQEVTVVQTDYEVAYPTVTLDDAGEASLKIYAGNHRIEIDRPGFNPVRQEFNVADGETACRVEVSLEERNRRPHSLTATARHDVLSGKDEVSVGWNIAPPVFFDDFEAYTPFAIEFGDWTGIDGDGEATAALVGSYPNRGVMQYAQVINPLTVTPTWWYDYPVLRPYAGQQYAGFIRTSSGNANDDWLISPVITPGEENELSFMAKGADRWPERFMIYVTTVTDSPSASDFVRIDTGNYESVDYKEWQRKAYDLSAYAGTPIRFAIRYVADANRYGAFMLMVDDVCVAQKRAAQNAPAAQSRRVMRSPDNPYETFSVTLDGVEVGTTDGYSLVIPDVAPGVHTVGVQALYRASQSEVTETQVEVPQTDYHALRIALTADSHLEADRMEVSLLCHDNAETVSLTTEGGSAEVPSLWPGDYTLRIEEGPYELVAHDFTLDADRELALTLEDLAVAPFNLTTTPTETGIRLDWNRESVFADSFEDYPDFATGDFGEGWKTIDNDGLPVYPIALGNQTNIVTFPGSGTATNPMPVPPMVFNPWETTPPMLPEDPAIAAPTGDKTVIFFSPQGRQADKWLISPPIDIRDDFEFAVSAKGYAMYPEAIDLCISDGGTNPADFTVLAAVDQLTSQQWTRYSVPLEGHAGQGKRLAVRYRSVDAFLAQVDDFTVGPPVAALQTEDYGNVGHFTLYLDGEETGTTTDHDFTFENLTGGVHRLGVKAVYKSRESEISEVEVNAGYGLIPPIGAESGTGAPAYDLQGRKASNSTQGIIVTTGKKTIKK